MSAKDIKILDLRSRREWREWLQKHHDSETVIWLLFHKTHTEIQAIPYDDAVEEALCFGWIDSIIKRLDDDRYLRKFTPRNPGSKWSSINCRRYDSLKERGLLAPAGLERSPTNRSGDAPRPSLTELPPYIEKELKANARAWNYFERLAASYKRVYIGWIESAKRQETKEKRLREAIELLAAGKKPGLK